MEKTDFYQSHLDRVSRSFAFCIQQLRSPLRSWVSLTYLICRILDTLEDAPWPHKQKQMELFAEFQRSLISPGKLDQFMEQTLEVPKGISRGERKLLRDSKTIFTDLHRIPQKTRLIIQEMVQSMSLGMQFFLHKQKNGGLKLRSLSELNQYCFFVAGVVGEALSKLLFSVDGNFKVKRELILKSFHFGLFLQKINILKDQQSDENEGRFFVPDRNMVFRSLVKNADNTFSYICDISPQHKDYKLFCLWSFFLGMASIPYIEKSFLSKKPFKISRLETWNLLDNIKSNIDNNDYLAELFAAYRKSLVEVAEKGLHKESMATSDLDLNFLKCYIGQLTRDELIDLGLIA